MSKFMRSAVLFGYADVARDVGLDAFRTLQRVGLRPGCLQNGDLKIPVEKVVALLEETAQLSGVDTVGLRMAEQRRLSNLGLVGLLARDQPTLREALSTTMRYMPLHNQAITMSIDERDGIAAVQLDIVGTGSTQVRQSMELLVGAFFRILRVFLGNDWRAQQICFRHGAASDLSRYQRFFGSPVRFAQTFDGLVLASRELDAQIASADPIMARYARQIIESMSDADDAPVSHEVNQLIAAMLPAGRCTTDNLAQHMGIDRRTLHRRLQGEGTTFSQLLNEARRNLVQRYLGNEHLSMAQIAIQLGFSNQSSFAQWHRREFGVAATLSARTLQANARRTTS